ncbi:MAG: M43 family zinc metalloprotease [Vicingaceae bacterium]
MKQIIILISFFFVSISIQAQAEWCGTDQMLEQWFESHPEDRIKFENQTQQPDLVPRAKGGQNNKAPNYIIPVVVHVIHFNGRGNISKAQILDGIDIINEDFNLMNSDTSNVRNVFKSLIADVQVEFRLANLDPNGNCTDGINRINSFQTFDNRNEVKRLGYWDATEYFNVWIVNTINDGGAPGNVLGYAQFPRFGRDSTYGIVVRADEWGSIGLASSKDGRTVTHEVGHCLDLLHTFQSGCGFSCTTSGDFVCDTPPQASSHNNSCDTTFNSCSNDDVGGGSFNPFSTNVPDQLENYMGYGLSCLGMFTEGQKDRMENALVQVNKLIDVTKSTNLTNTGTNNGYTKVQCPPVADLYFETPLMICKGDSITFTDNSYRDTVATYTWTFPGGNPSTSSDSNPTVQYSTPGIYDVELKVANAAGADSIIVSNQVIVHDTANNISGFQYFEGFENASSFSDWTVISSAIEPDWERSSLASKSGSFSAYLNNFNVEINDNININQFDYLISPPIDMSQVLNPTIKFQLAYKGKSAASNDIFKVGISTDCGSSWSTRFFANSSSTLISSGNSSSNFTPTSSEWKSVTVTLTSAMRASKNLLIRFDLTSGNGNNIYIDDVEVTGMPVGLTGNVVEESNFNLYPNPTNDGFYLEIEDSKVSEQASIFMTNIVGEKVKDIVSEGLSTNNKRVFVETSNLSSGIYFVSYQNNGRRITKKLIVN